MLLAQKCIEFYAWSHTGTASFKVRETTDRLQTTGQLDSPSLLAWDRQTKTHVAACLHISTYVRDLHEASILGSPQRLLISRSTSSGFQKKRKRLHR